MNTRVYLQIYDRNAYNYFYNYTRGISINIRVFIYTLIITNKLIYSYKCTSKF